MRCQFQSLSHSPKYPTFYSVYQHDVCAQHYRIEQATTSSTLPFCFSLLSLSLLSNSTRQDEITSIIRTLHTRRTSKQASESTKKQFTIITMGFSLFRKKKSKENKESSKKQVVVQESAVRNSSPEKNPLSEQARGSPPKPAIASQQNTKYAARPHHPPIVANDPPPAREAAFAGPPRFDWIDIVSSKWNMRQLLGLQRVSNPMVTAS
jgi:hypothetical protein